MSRYPDETGHPLIHEARHAAIQTVAAVATALHDIGGGCFASERGLRHVLEVLASCGVRRIRDVGDICPPQIWSEPLG